MKTNQTAPSIAEQKAIIRDCMEKTAHIHQTMVRLFPRITLGIDPGYTFSERRALDIYQDYTVGLSNDLADIYGHLIGKEVNHV